MLKSKGLVNQKHDAARDLSLTTATTMRLLHTKTFKLYSFFGSEILSYAILSHRWGNSETTFQDLKSGKGVEIAQADVKIAGCCAQAVKDGYQYVVS